MWSVFHVLVSNLAAGLHSNCSWARNDWLIQVYSTLQLSWSSCVSLPFSLSLSTGLSVCLFVCHTLPGRFGIPSNFLSSILAPEAIKLTCLSSTDQPLTLGEVLHYLTMLEKRGISERESWRRFCFCSMCGWSLDLTNGLSLPQDFVNSFPFTCTVNKVTQSGLLSPMFWVRSASLVMTTVVQPRCSKECITFSRSGGSWSWPQHWVGCWISILHLRLYQGCCCFYLF